MNISIIGTNIKKIREAKGLSAYKLSKMAKVGGATISEIESGIRQSLNTETANKIAVALGVSPDDLMVGENDKEYIVTDLCETINLILTSDDLTLDNIKVSDSEKKQFKTLFDAAIDVIRSQRK
jgi:transcriptional regulator with XRE-family HTH domain